MKEDYYILENRQPKIVTELEHAKWFRTENKNVAFTELPGGVKISTDFIGYKPPSSEIPILFETAISGGEHDGYEERFETWGEAEEGHKDAIRLVVNNPD